MPYKYNPFTKQMDYVNFGNFEVAEIRDSVAYYFLATSSTPITRYVATTGSDTTGDGTLTNPYATPKRAYEDIPYRLAHKGKILIAAGDYPDGSWPRTIDTIYVGDGSLSIVGVGTPRVISGPFTVTGLTVKRTGCVHRIAVAAGAWDADELCGTFLRIKTGAHPNASYQVYGNGSDWIDVQHYTSSEDVHNGDTFEIIRPAVKITCNQGGTLMYQCYNSLETSTGSGGNGRLILHNLWLDATASPSLGEIFSVRSFGNGLSSPVFEFVLLEGSADTSVYPTGPWGILDLVDSGINVWAAYDTDYVADGATGLHNMEQIAESPGLSVHSALGRAATTLVTTEGNCGMSAVASTGGITIYHGEAQFNFCSVGGITGWVNGISKLTFYGRCDAPAADGVGIDLWTTSSVWVRAYFQRGKYAIVLNSNSDLELDACVCDGTAITDQAVSLGAMTRVRLSGAHTNFVGAGSGGGAYIWQTTGGKAAAWPAVNKTGANDGLGAFIMRVDY